MIKGAAGRRYARAIFDFASEAGNLDQWMSDLRDIRDFLAEPAVAQVLDNPEIPFENKQKIIMAGLKGMDPLRVNFVKLLVRKGRTDIIDDIIAQYERLVNEHLGIAVADVTTAIPLDSKTTDLVAKRLSALIGKKVTVRTSVDPEIIGGLVAKVGDRLIDGSLVGQLAALRTRLVQG